MLKDLRKRAGLTQAELAIKLGIKQGSISNWENGTSNPDNLWETPEMRSYGERKEQ
jgi:DNA-binding helix-turn-helix protein